MDDSKYFSTLFGKGNVGFIICERVITMKEIGAQLFINMFDEYHKSEVARHSFRIISFLYPTDAKMPKKCHKCKR